MNKLRKPLVLNDFCLRQFKDPRNCSFIDIEPSFFMKQLNEVYLHGLTTSENGDPNMALNNIS